MIQISNQQLTARIHEKGAELQGLHNHHTQLEYMWCGDPAFWGKTSPVLFPVVGGLKNNSYRYNNQTWHMGRHGLARDMVFSVVEQTTDAVVFELTHTEETLTQYPFPFRLRIAYSIKDTSLRVAYSVYNPSNTTLYFSLGAHPAFAVPLVPGSSFEDHYLQFSEEETTGIWPLSQDGAIEDKPVPYLDTQQNIPLTKELFYGDALVFKGLRSSELSILHKTHPHGITVSFPHFPYLGIWSARNADFVCIEPWHGIADHVNSTGNLEEKEGIIALAAQASFECAWSVQCF